MRLHRHLLLSIALPVGFAASQAVAADYEPPLVAAPGPLAMEEVYVEEIETAPWYIRGDIGVAVNDIPGFRSDTSDIGEFDFGSLSYSLGAGYRFNDIVRTDAEIGFVGSGSFERDGYTSYCPGSGTLANGQPVNGLVVPCLANADGEAYAFTGLANVYVDLFNVAGFTPYVGAGAGLAIAHYEDNSGFECTSTGQLACDFEGAYSRDESSTEPSFAYQLSAGFAYDVAPYTAIDFGYRYLQIEGDKKLTRGGANTVIDDRDEGYHQIRIGLRYGFH